MLTPHDPETDGYRGVWTVHGMDQLGTKDYRQLLQRLGQMGLVVTVPPNDMIVTRKAFRDFALTRGASPNATTAAWGSLWKESTYADDPVVRQATAADGTVGLSGSSLAQAAVERRLAEVRGLSSSDSMGRAIVERFIREQVVPTLAGELPAPPPAGTSPPAQPPPAPL